MAFLAAIPAAFGAIAGGTATAAQVAIATGTIATGISAVGVGVAGYSAYKQSQFQAAVAKNNAEISANNANSTLLSGAAKESEAKLATGRKIGAALAAQGANGVDVSFGSPVTERGALQNEGDLDALTIRHNAAVSAMGYMQQSGGFAAESSLDKQAGTNAIVGSALNVGSSLIGGASSVADKYSTYKLLGAH